MSYFAWNRLQKKTKTFLSYVIKNYKIIKYWQDFDFNLRSTSPAVINFSTFGGWGNSDLPIAAQVSTSNSGCHLVILSFEIIIGGSRPRRNFSWWSFTRSGKIIWRNNILQLENGTEKWFLRNIWWFSIHCVFKIWILTHLQECCKIFFCALTILLDTCSSRKQILWYCLHPASFYHFWVQPKAL